MLGALCICQCLNASLLPDGGIVKGQGRRVSQIPEGLFLAAGICGGEMGNPTGELMVIPVVRGDVNRWLDV